jgi:hypothetical protein
MVQHMWPFLLGILKFNKKKRKSSCTYDKEKDMCLSLF